MITKIWKVIKSHKRRTLAWLFLAWTGPVGVFAYFFVYSENTGPYSDAYATQYFYLHVLCSLAWVVVGIPLYHAYKYEA